MNMYEYTGGNLLQTDDISGLVLSEIPSRFQNLGSITFIGSGAAGEVYKISGEHEYALKVIKCDNDAQYRNALYELRIMEKLKGEPHTVQLCDHETVNQGDIKTVYILEDFHRTMTDYLTGDSFRIADLIKLIMGVCDSLSACVKSGVLHLDVNPNNIFIDNLSCIMVGDFSHSLSLCDVPANHTSRGTLAYMAPEVYQKGSCSERSDLYSLGLVLYSLFNRNRLPFMDSNAHETAIYKRLAGTGLPELALPDKEVQNKMNSIISKACAYEQINRYPGFSEFREDLSRLYEFCIAKPESNIEIISEPESWNTNIVPLIYVLQTSDSMSDLQIASMKHLLEETAQAIGDQASDNNVDVRISVLSFGGQTEWLAVNSGLNSFNLDIAASAAGPFQLGPVLQELNRELSGQGHVLRKFLGRYYPIIVFVTDGMSDDDFESSLSELKKNPRYRGASRICFTSGEKNNVKNLAMLAGSAECILKYEDYDNIRSLIRFLDFLPSVYGHFENHSETSDTLKPRNDSAKGIGDSSEPEWSAFDSDGFSWGDSSSLTTDSSYNPFSQFSIGDPFDSFGYQGNTFAKGNRRYCRVCAKPIDDASNYCPYCGCKVSIDKADINIRSVEFSAIAPKQLSTGEYSIINIVMYEKSSRDIVDSIIREMDEPAQESRSGTHSVKDGSSIKVVLKSPDISIDDNEETGVWQGDYLDFSFAVSLPEQFKKTKVLFNASIFINDVIACRLKFIVKCSSSANQKIDVSRDDIFSAFVSYASQDRSRVAMIIQGMKKARPDMDIFFDVDSLISGEDWEKALHQEIARRDVLYLCWSHFARESKWVDNEWRYALELKGADSIEPIPIEPPEVCPPPAELNHKHFNDKLLYIINASNHATIEKEQSQTVDPDWDCDSDW